MEVRRDEDFAGRKQYDFYKAKRARAGNSGRNFAVRNRRFTNALSSLTRGTDRGQKHRILNRKNMTQPRRS